LSYKTGDELEIKIERIVPRGLGIGFGKKLTVFVPLAVAGDVVRVSLNQVKGKIAFADIVEVLSPSPARIAPPCPYFGACGGCDFQQMSYQTQLEAKAGIVRDSLHRIGKIDYDKEIEIIGSPRPFEYRSRAQWHIDTVAKRIGYFKRGSHEVIDVGHCPILVPELENTLRELRDTIEWDSFWDEGLAIEAAGGDGGKVSVYGSELIEPTDEISFTAAGEKYFYSARSFFQGNQFLVEKLIETAVGDAQGEKALDLYCGVGLFTLPLARRFREVVGVEGNEEALVFAEKNAAHAGLENISYVREGVDKFVAEGRAGGFGLVLLDPPRAGAGMETIQRLARIKPKNISYVSCDPSILARDLRIFLDAGYEITSLTALDLFPQTHHVETVARLAFK
jgi:tRNA/tmRNA/rRNA uracil-C5-methylase (TrmA/RlmC/RlmD family)